MENVAGAKPTAPSSEAETWGRIGYAEISTIAVGRAWCGSCSSSGVRKDLQQ
ncbi:MAG: hypothetical protein RL701_1187 [Pseudomonadota bacterium]